MTPLLLALGWLAALPACSRDGDTGGADDTAAAGRDPAIDLACPGDPGCEDNDGALRVGVATVPITPDCFESWEDLDGDWEYDSATEPFLDCGCDRLCEGDEGWPGPDEGEGDGEFQAVWMAGFNNGMPAQSVRDDLWARAVVLDQGATRLALVEVDLVGFFRPDVLAAREALAATDADVDLLVVASTHTHEGPDTMGLWGPSEGVSGVDADYVASVRAAIVSAVEEEVAGLQPVGAVETGAADMRDYHDNGVHNVMTDIRDPVIIDEGIQTVRFVGEGGDTLATLVHLGDHPESLADENTGISSDFPHGLRETVESGASWDALSVDGVGGTAVFVNGAVGGMMTSLRVDTEDPDGVVWDDYTYERTLTIGRLMGVMALDAIAAGEPMDDPKLRFARRVFRLPVDNYAFQALFLTGIIDRDLYDYDPSLPIDADNTPTIETEIDLVRLGDLTLLTVPGELFPELAIGGYDGSRTGGGDVPLVDPDNPNPPDLDAAPEGPYILDRLPGAMRWVVGLANDELGYVVPAYDFQLDDTLPWFEEAEGDHYEETNSLTATFAPALDAEVDALVGWAEENQP